MKTVLWINPTGRDKREISRLASTYNIQLLYHTYARESLQHVCVETRSRNTLAGCRMPCDEIERISDIAQQIPIDGIMTSRDYPSSTLVAAIANNLGIPAPSVASNILTQHKYHARRILDSCIPEANPEYALLTYDTISTCPLKPPYIIKPIKAAGSMGTYYITDTRDIANISNLPAYAYYQPFAELLATYTPYRMDTPQVIAESYTTGHQANADGYVCNGQVHMLGIVDSHFYPNTFSFYKFTYPSSLPYDVQQRMHAIAQKSITALGLDNTLFNIEFIYNQECDTITIIEINPRISSQFSPLYEGVDNINTYRIGLELTLGYTPHIPNTPGPYSHAASFALRTPHDHFVYATPSLHEREAVYRTYPNSSIEICCQPGRYLSEFQQDTYTYLYAIINIASNSEAEAENTCSCIQHMLNFDFV